jgi:hypothetical protein
MDRLKWKVVSETNSRLEAEFIKSYFEAQEIEVELVQESIGHTIYPVTVDGLGRVQIFVPEDKIIEAKELLKAYLENSEGREA